MLSESNANDEYKRNERNKLDSLLGWCEITTCRRHALLRYFGESLGEGLGEDIKESAKKSAKESRDEYRNAQCGTCDVCLNPPKTWDATVNAQKLLSCIYRTGQRFGINHVIDVLRGKQTDKVQQCNHHPLSTFNIGNQYSDTYWRSIARQLIVGNFIHVDGQNFGIILLTEKARPLLRSEMTLLLREDTTASERGSVQRKSPRRSGHKVSDNDKSLWDALRACRKQLAETNGVPPYVIFHDATLMEMMEYKPATENEMLAISGIGKSKWEKFGKQFVAVVKAYC
jgi:ATP-dependent DNA helicase RecQ